MRFESLQRAAKVALSFGLAVSAKAANLSAPLQDIAHSGPADNQPTAALIDVLTGGTQFGGSATYSILAGLCVMGAIAFRRKT